MPTAQESPDQVQTPVIDASGDRPCIAKWTVPSTKTGAIFAIYYGDALSQATQNGEEYIYWSEKQASEVLPSVQNLNMGICIYALTYGLNSARMDRNLEQYKLLVEEHGLTMADLRCQ